MNNVTLVGRLVSDPVIKKLDDGKNKTTITLAISRNYKNADGEYETDFINCVLWNNIATATVEYCHKGDIVGIKARLQSRSYEVENEKKYIMEVIAEKVTFLSKANNHEKS